MLKFNLQTFWQNLINDKNLQSHSKSVKSVNLAYYPGYIFIENIVLHQLRMISNDLSGIADLF